MKHNWIFPCEDFQVSFIFILQLKKHRDKVICFKVMRSDSDNTGNRISESWTSALVLNLYIVLIFHSLAVKSKNIEEQP